MTARKLAQGGKKENRKFSKFLNHLIIGTYEKSFLKKCTKARKVAQVHLIIEGRLVARVTCHGSRVTERLSRIDYALHLNC
jgi:hypothetical protein